MPVVETGSTITDEENAQQIPKTGGKRRYGSVAADVHHSRSRDIGCRIQKSSGKGE